MSQKPKSYSYEEILEGFYSLGLPVGIDRPYLGAEHYGAQFDRCSILKDLRTFASGSTAKNP